MTVVTLNDRYQQNRMISGFHHKVNENCAPLGYYTESSGNSFPLFWGNLWVPLRGWDQQVVLLRNYHYSLCNNPEERSYHNRMRPCDWCTSNSCSPANVQITLSWLSCKRAAYFMPSKMFVFY